MKNPVGIQRRIQISLKTRLNVKFGTLNANMTFVL